MGRVFWILKKSRHVDGPGFGIVNRDAIGTASLQAMCRVYMVHATGNNATC